MRAINRPHPATTPISLCKNLSTTRCPQGPCCSAFSQSVKESLHCMWRTKNKSFFVIFHTFAASATFFNNLCGLALTVSLKKEAVTEVEEPRGKMSISFTKQLLEKMQSLFHKLFRKPIFFWNSYFFVFIFFLFTCLAQTQCPNHTSLKTTRLKNAYTQCITV